MPRIIIAYIAVVDGQGTSRSSDFVQRLRQAHELTGCDPALENDFRSLLDNFWSSNADVAELFGTGVLDAQWLRKLYPASQFCFVLTDPYRRLNQGVSPRQSGEQWRTLAEGFSSRGGEFGEVLNLDGPSSLDHRKRLQALTGRAVSDTESNPQLPERTWHCLRRTVEPLAGQLGYSMPTHVVRHYNPPAVIDRSCCVVLVPVGSRIVPACDDSLRELERRGYSVRRVYGYAAIDQGRNQMAADAMRDGFEQTMWIDSDIAFNPDDVDLLRSRNEPIIGGIYPKKGRRTLACQVLPHTQSIQFGQGGRPFELQYAATGFLLVHRQVYLDVQQELEYRVVNQAFKEFAIPFFQPMIRPHGVGHWYLAEDYAFCERARRSGYAIMADPAIRLWHVGDYPYGWENAGADRDLFDPYVFHIGRPNL